MPKFGEDVALESHNIGHFGFTAVAMDDLEAAGYTLATIVCDRSGSTDGHQKPMEDALKSAIEALRKSPTAESIMVRVVTVDTDCVEQHGFIPLADIDVSRYDGMLAPQGITALFDGCVNAAEASTAYGQQLLKGRYNANAIVIVITDGLNNAGKFSQASDVSYVREAFVGAKADECLESFTSILIAVNTRNKSVQQGLAKFHADAGFSISPMIELQDATPEAIAKIGKFVVDSISSTSTALGTGGASQTISF